MSLQLLKKIPLNVWWKILLLIIKNPKMYKSWKHRRLCSDKQLNFDLFTLSKSAQRWIFFYPFINYSCTLPFVPVHSGIWLSWRLLTLITVNNRPVQPHYSLSQAKCIIIIVSHKRAACFLDWAQVLTGVFYWFPCEWTFIMSKREIGSWCWLCLFVFLTSNVDVVLKKVDI